MNWTRPKNTRRRTCPIVRDFFDNVFIDYRVSKVFSNVVTNRRSWIDDEQVKRELLAKFVSPEKRSVVVPEGAVQLDSSLFDYLSEREDTATSSQTVHVGQDDQMELRVACLEEQFEHLQRCTEMIFHLVQSLINSK